jgi:hypothetical protein
MVRTRGIRKFAEGGAVEAEAETPAPSIADDATIALQGQISALKQAEQHAAQPAPEPLSPLETALRAMPDPMQKFLRANSRFILNATDNAKIIAVDAELRAAGAEWTSPEFWDEMARRLLPQPVADIPPKADEEIYTGRNSHVRFSQRKERDPIETPNVNRQAPPSRERMQSNGKPYLSDDYRSVDLTPADKEHARVAGVDLKTYAMGKLELARRKERGEIQ